MILEELKQDGKLNGNMPVFVISSEFVKRPAFLCGLLLLSLSLNTQQEIQISVTVSKSKKIVCDKAPFTIRDTGRVQEKLPD